MLIAIALLKITALLIALFIGAMAGFIVGCLVDEDEEDYEDEPLDASEAWRQINLACGDGYKHPDACPALVGLREAGYTIEKSGSDRAGFCYLKIIQPGHKD